MGWRFRRRITLFPGVRVNLSARGISTTFGVPGASINVGRDGAFINTGIPGTGFYNRKKIGGDYQPFSPKYDDSPDSPLIFIPDALKAIKSKDTETITSEGLKDLKETLKAAFQEKQKLKCEVEIGEDELHRAERSLKYFSWIPFHKTFFKSGFDIRQTEVEECRKSLQDAKKQLAECKVSVNVVFEKSALPQYELLKQAFYSLQSCTKIWDVTSSKAIDAVRERSAATTSIERKHVSINLDQVDFVNSEHQAFHFSNANGDELYFFPVFLLVFGNCYNFAMISYEDLKIGYANVSFVESDPVPSDAIIISNTWRYVNKDGSRDRRFVDNYQIPVVRYGEISFTSSQGLNEVYHFSNAQYAADFVRAFLKYLIIAAGGTLSDINDSTSEKPKTTITRQKALEILGLKKEVSTQLIQDAYYELIKKYHPDKVTHLGDEFRIIAEKKTKEINEAYEFLMS